MFGVCSIPAERKGDGAGNAGSSIEMAPLQRTVTGTLPESLISPRTANSNEGDQPTRERTYAIAIDGLSLVPLVAACPSFSPRFIAGAVFDGLQGGVFGIVPAVRDCRNVGVTLLLAGVAAMSCCRYRST